MLLLALLIPATTYADATMPFTRIFTLGDSLTDGGAYSGTVIASGAPAGNLYKFTTNFTDGSAKVWAEYLAAAIGLPLQPNIVSGVQDTGTNYAQGGAQIATDPSIETNLPLGITAFSIRQQVNNLLQQNPRLNAHDQIIIWGGANDVLSALDNVSTAGGTPLSLQAATTQITQAANDLVTQINRLKAAGATYIIVNTLPNMGQTPRAISDGPGTVALAQTLSVDVFNATLKQALRGSNVVIVDSAKILNAIVSLFSLLCRLSNLKVCHQFERAHHCRMVPALAAVRDTGTEQLLSIGSIRQGDTKFAGIRQREVQVFLMQLDTKTRIERAFDHTLAMHFQNF